jgi:hypothetical protein
MKVIFLDVDGPLTYSDYENKDTSNIDIEKVKLLKQICDKTGAKVVISSSWRGIPGHVPHIYQILLNILSDNDIPVIGEIPYIKTEFEDKNPFNNNSPATLTEILHTKVKHGTGRAAEIRQWLQENPVEQFVILDDEDYAWSEYGYDNNWVRPTWFGNGGLKQHHVEEAVKILNSKPFFVRVLFGNTSTMKPNIAMETDKIIVADNWNADAKTPEEMGGINFSNETNILRWFVRGDTIYDVKIPPNATVISVPNPSTPNGVFRADKIVITNPRPITDELAMYYYKKSIMPEKTYYKALAGLALRGCINTAKQLIKDKVKKDNVNEVIKEFNDFPKPYRKEDNKEVYQEIVNVLNNIKK